MEKINIKDILPPRLILKKHSKMQITEISESIKEFGQYKPILLQKSSNRIICGYGVYLALKKLNIKEVFVKKIEVTDEEADNIRFTDNYSNESSKWNEDKLQYLFMEMSDDLIKVSGFELEEVENIFNDSTELLKRGIEKSESVNQPLSNENDMSSEENIENVTESIQNEENNSSDNELKEKEVITDVEFIKIRYCGCCGKYYDADGNELDLLR